MHSEAGPIETFADRKTELTAADKDFLRKVMKKNLRLATFWVGVFTLVSLIWLEPSYNHLYLALACWLLIVSLIWYRCVHTIDKGIKQNP